MSEESELRSMRLEMVKLREEVDQAVDKITELVRSIQLDDKLRARAEEAEEKERDRQHEVTEKLLESIKDNGEAILEALPKVCQANDLGAAIRTYTWEQKQKTEREEKEREERQQREAIARAVKDATGPHPLPPAPFPLPGPTMIGSHEQSGSFRKVDEDSILPTPAQERWLKRKWDWVSKHKIHFVWGGLSGVGWAPHLWKAVKAAAVAAWQAFGG